jgi:hypothetical protein
MKDPTVPGTSPNPWGSYVPTPFPFYLRYLSQECPKIRDRVAPEIGRLSLQPSEK